MPMTELCCSECGFTHVGHFNRIPGACEKMKVKSNDEEITGLDANGDVLPVQQKETNESKNPADSPSGIQP